MGQVLAENRGKTMIKTGKGLWTAGLLLAAGAMVLTAGVAEARKRHHRNTDTTAADAPATGAAPYIGTWAKTADACKADAGTDKAPFVLKAKRLMQFETDCGLSSIKNAGKLWTANAVCKVQGDKQRHSLVLTVDGDTMEFGWDSPKGEKLVRCK